MTEHLDPALVSPIAAWLVHEDCPVTGEIYSAAGGRIARYFIGLTPGYYDPKLTVEDVRDHFDEIRDEKRLHRAPVSPSDEFAHLARQLSPPERRRSHVAGREVNEGVVA